MKRIVLTLALAIGSLSMMNATEIPVNDGIVDEIVVGDFQEIPVDQVPEAVVQALATSYEGAEIQKAFVNDKKQYKLEVTTADGNQGTLYADEEGNWLQMDES